MLDVTPPQALQIPEAPTKIPRKLDHASINSLAYDLVTKVALEEVCEAYQITLTQLNVELQNNPHLKQALASWKQTIAEHGAFNASVIAAAAETLPFILQDNISEGTDPTIRSRNMKMLMDHKSQQDKIRAERDKATQDGPAIGVQVSMNVSPGIRGISAAPVTINQE